MFVQSMMPQWTAILITAFLTALSTRPAAALIPTPTLELYSAHTNAPSPSMIYTDFTPCVFSGYAPDVVTLSGAVNLGPQTLGALANGNFIATAASPFIPDTAIGYMLSDGATTVYLAEDFASPVPFAAPGDFLDFAFASALGMLNATAA